MTASTQGLSCISSRIFLRTSRAFTVCDSSSSGGREKGGSGKGRREFRRGGIGTERVHILSIQFLEHWPRTRPESYSTCISFPHGTNSIAPLFWNFRVCQSHLAGFVKHPLVSGSIDLGLGSKICISNRLQGMSVEILRSSHLQTCREW